MKLFSKNKKTSLTGDVVVLSTSQVVIYAISMVCSMLLSRFRTLEEYGTYSQMLMVVNLFSTIFMMGLPSCINYFLARADTKEERNTFLSVYYILNTSLSFIVGLILVLAVPLMEAYFKNGNIGRYVIFLAIFPWTKIITSSVENLLVVHKRSDFLVAYRIFHSIVVLGCIFITKILSMSFTVYIYLYLVSEILFTCIVYFLAIYLDGKFVFNFKFSKIKEILNFSVPLGLSTASGTLKAEMDKFVVGYFLSTDIYAIYANASKELPLTFIASSITAVLMPVIARKIRDRQTNDALKLWNEATIISFFINAFFALGLFVFSKEAMTFLYSEKYESGATVFAVYSLVLIFRSTYFGMILQSSGKTRTILVGSVMSLVINFVLNILLFYLFGMTGPAIATIVSICWNAGYQLYETSKTVDKSICEIFPWKDLGKIMLANIVLGAVAHTVKVIVPLENYITNSGEAFLLAFLWLAVYVFIFRDMINEKLKIFKQFK